MMYGITDLCVHAMKNLSSNHYLGGRMSREHLSVFTFIYVYCNGPARAPWERGGGTGPRSCQLPRRLAE